MHSVFQSVQHWVSASNDDGVSDVFLPDNEECMKSPQIKKTASSGQALEDLLEELSNEANSDEKSRKTEAVSDSESDDDDEESSDEASDDEYEHDDDEDGEEHSSPNVDEEGADFEGFLSIANRDHASPIMSPRLKLSPTQVGDVEDDELEMDNLSEVVDLMGVDDAPENSQMALKKAIEAESNQPEQRTIKTLLPDGSVVCLPADNPLVSGNSRESKYISPTPDDFESVHRIPLWEVSDHRRTHRPAAPSNLFSWVSRIMERPKRKACVRGMRSDAA